MNNFEIITEDAQKEILGSSSSSSSSSSRLFVELLSKYNVKPAVNHDDNLFELLHLMLLDINKNLEAIEEVIEKLILK